MNCLCPIIANRSTRESASPVYLIKDRLFHIPATSREFAAFQRLRSRSKVFCRDKVTFDNAAPLPGHQTPVPCIVLEMVEQAHEFLKDCSETIWAELMQAEWKHKGKVIEIDKAGSAGKMTASMVNCSPQLLLIDEHSM